MSQLPYLTNAFGTTQFTKPGQGSPIKWVSSNGSVGLNKTPSTFFSQHVRSGKSSNPPQVLVGSLRKWRNPSSYSRHQRTYEVYNPGHYFLNGKLWYVKDCYIDWGDVQTGVNVYSTNPLLQGGSITSIVTTSAEVQNARTRAISKALDDLGSKKANVGENLAQLTQTIDSFATLAKSGIDIVKLFIAIKKGHIPKFSSWNARKLKKAILNRTVDKRLANNWLAYWYGLHPLVGDAQGLYELIVEQQKPVLLVHGRGRGQASWSGDYQAPSYASLTPAMTFHDDSDVKVQCSLTGTVNGQLIRNLNRIGLLNLPSLAWELVPFSFCVDWLVPVGEMFSNMASTVGLTFKGGTVTTRSEREIRCEVQSNWVKDGLPPLSYYRGFGFNRERLSNFPSAGLYVKPFYTGLDRYATIAALISNLTSGHKGYR